MMGVLVWVELGCGGVLVWVDVGYDGGITVGRVRL